MGRADGPPARCDPLSGRAGLEPMTAPFVRQVRGAIPITIEQSRQRRFLPPGARCDPDHDRTKQPGARQAPRPTSSSPDREFVIAAAGHQEASRQDPAFTPGTNVSALLQAAAASSFERLCTPVSRRKRQVSRSPDVAEERIVRFPEKE